MDHRVSFLLTLLLGACSGATPPSKVLAIPTERHVEGLPLPEDPREKGLPKELPKEDWVVALEAGDAADRSGIFLSEARAWRDAQFRILYPPLRSNYIADRKVWAVQREFMQERIWTAEKRIEEVRPSWLQRNGLSLGVSLGFVLGTAATVAILSVTDNVRASASN